MRPQATKRFRSDLLRVRSVHVLDTVEFLFNLVRTVDAPEQIPGFKWLTGYPNLGRVSIGDHRIGVELLGDRVIFRCLLHRSVIYQKFP